MNIRATLAVLLTLCGVGFALSAQAADFRCLVYSGADGSKLEKTSTGDGAYAVTAADLKAAEAGALKKGAQYKKGVVLTRAECTPVGATSGTAPAPQPAAPPPSGTTAPASGGEVVWYCYSWAANGARLDAAKEAPSSDRDDIYYKITAGALSVTDREAQAAMHADALALAKKYDARVDSVECNRSKAAFE